MKKTCCLILAVLLATLTARSQGKDTNIFALPIEMDEFVLQASRDGFDVAAFIQRVKEDTTFYKAFRTLHLVPFTAINDIKIYDKKEGVKASLHSRTQQHRIGNCRTMEVLEEKTTSDFYNRKKEYNNYTSELYASFFFTEGKICGENINVKDYEHLRGKGR